MTMRGALNDGARRSLAGLLDGAGRECGGAAGNAPTGWLPGRRDVSHALTDPVRGLAEEARAFAAVGRGAQA